jgi:hypothetical protein
MEIIEFRINRGTPSFPFTGRGDFSRPDFGRLKPPLPLTNAPKISFITFAKLNFLEDQSSVSWMDSDGHWLTQVQHSIHSSGWTGFDLSSSS